MPARTAPVLVKKIRHLRRQGLQLGEIAREVGVGRGTVAKYAGKVDTQVELEDVAGEFTAAQRAALMRLVELPVEKVELLVDSVRTYTCKGCGEALVLAASSPGFRCPTCRTTRWYLGAAPLSTAPSPVAKGPTPRRQNTSRR